ncbi:nuclear export factor GLE1 [Micromonospora deserti]|uniref:Nuclear export factor GLE1 n=2 Tax=Micromonospora deserti TaxID=2070366 RepID=A0A2W2CMZ8_9ACTN|nr:nuclear export factor GLE1 [Micromonospora deserti]
MTRGDSAPRRAGTVAVLAVAGVLGWPGTAYAVDVTTTPAQARQGDAVKVDFVVPEQRSGTRTERVEVRLPADAPIAEVYPMSVAGWAPRIDSRALDQPVAGIHAAGVRTVTSAVIWTRMPGAADAPARLTLSMGPLPRVDRLAFEVVQTYADGTVVRWTGPDGAHPAPALTLLPAAPGAAGAAGHGGHAAAPGGGSAGAAADGGLPGPAVAGEAAGGNADALLAAGLLAGLGGGVAIGWLVSRWRRRGQADPVDRSVLRGEPAADGSPAADRETPVAAR